MVVMPGAVRAQAIEPGTDCHMIVHMGLVHLLPARHAAQVVMGARSFAPGLVALRFAHLALAGFEFGTFGPDHCVCSPCRSGLCALRWSFSHIYRACNLTSPDSAALLRLIDQCQRAAADHMRPLPVPSPENVSRLRICSTDVRVCR